MRLLKGLRKLPLYAYCHDCTWQDSGTGKAPALYQEAAAHVTSTSHEARISRTQEIVIRPAAEPAGVTT